MANTPNLQMQLPLIGGDVDQWGNEMNANLTIIDNLFTPTHGLGRVVREDAGGNIFGAGLDLDRPAGQGVLTNILRAGSFRWSYGATGEAESGGPNARLGTNFYLASYDNSGNVGNVVFAADRSTSILNFYANPTVGNPPDPGNPVLTQKNFPFSVLIEPVGTVKMYAGDTDPPVGTDLKIYYLICDGRLVNSSDYPILSSLLGNKFGPGAAGQFNLPDLRERIVVGRGRTVPPLLTQFPDAALTTTGSKIGEALHVLATGEMPSHNHTIHDSGHVHDFGYNQQAGGGSGTGTMNMNSTLTLAPTAVKSAPTGITIDPAGGGAGHNNVQPAMVMSYIIRVQ